MTAQLRVLIEEPTRGKRWVAVAADWRPHLGDPGPRSIRAIVGRRPLVLADELAHYDAACGS